MVELTLISSIDRYNILPVSEDVLVYCLGEDIVVVLLALECIDVKRLEEARVHLIITRCLVLFVLKVSHDSDFHSFYSTIMVVYMLFSYDVVIVVVVVVLLTIVVGVASVVGVVESEGL